MMWFAVARVRTLDDIQREMALFARETQNARAVYAAEADETKRPVIAGGEKNPDWQTNDSTLKQTRPLVNLTIPTFLVTHYKIPEGMDKWNELPPVLQTICLAYADYQPRAEVIYSYPSGTFFTRYLSQIQYRLEKAATDLLHGNIEMALALIKANKEAIHMPTSGCNRFGTYVEGCTLLQIAAMAGDVNLREKTIEEKEDHGALELLAEAAGLTKRQVADQLFPVLFSDDAKKINEARKNSILNLFIEFAENILKRKKGLSQKWESIAEFKAAQAIYVLEISKLRKDLLKLVSNKTITAGFILDSECFVDLIQRFISLENLSLKRPEDWESTVCDLFWVNGFGSLQYVAAARDGQVYNTGIGYSIDNKFLPDRSLNNSYGLSHFGPASTLGESFYLGYHGRDGGTDRITECFTLTQNLIANKNSSIAKFMRGRKIPSSKKTNRCLVM